ncbi:TPA: hydroxyisourate hydrolase [Burkholderia cenocepacia]|uniref:hydroxyisourate hydrolase n=1 Tax=Burkholderia cenocepacia TaxID=95486 RepID=UPI0009E0EA7E|nr:hydroxyisourate hydrolase [Burkholderia cenocepacia]ARF87028.1 5-hydroxyisourate hydrolase [Burkholderia cenocepacia]MCW3675938.1 hydroxyisourate hydrolase [Burkholderia cenocepacia]MDC6083867.1 hydroxyisourate hydrolase [Burkholderia cenocepacia]
MNDVIDSGRRRLVLATAALAAVPAVPAWAADAQPVPGHAPGVRHAASPDLTVRIVDMLHGVAAAGMRVELSRVDGVHDVPLHTATVDARGGTGAPLLAGDAYRAGTYTLMLHVGEYFHARGVQSPFLTVVPIRFRIARADERLHLPVQFGPWSYTVYRGT